MNLNDNPTVNRWLPDEAMDRMDHALGRPMWPLKETYRNHFATSLDDPRNKDFTSPNWDKVGERGGMAFFAVTEAGKQVLAAYLKDHETNRPFLIKFDEFETIVPAKSRGSAKYSYWLKVSDSWSELTFGEFVKRATVRAL